MSAPSTKRRKNYTLCDIDEAISKVKTGEISQAKAVLDYRIPHQNLSIFCKNKIDNVIAKRPDLALALQAEADIDLVHWFLAIQK